MALIKCPECSNEVSDSAPTCPKCGAPVAKPKQKPSGCFISILAVIVVFVLFAIFGGSHETSPAATSVTGVASNAKESTGNLAHDRLSALSTSERYAIFAKLLKLERCGGVNRDFFKGLDKFDDAFWTVACDSGDSYMIRVSDDSTGSTTITDCAVVKKVGVDCWASF